MAGNFDWIFEESKKLKKWASNYVKIPMTECQSSHIRAYGYDRATETLALSFESGTYHYHPVPQQMYDDFKASESKGSFLYHVIRKAVGNGVKQETAEVF